METTIHYRYKLNKSRKNMLHFMLQVRRQNSRYRYVMNKDLKGCHLNNCFASSSLVFDTGGCHCRRLEVFGDVHKVPDCKILSFQPWGPPVEEPICQTLDEPFELFFQRLQDRNNLMKWYEEYRTKSQALYFQGVVRDRKMSNTIDVQYHPFLKEWHLTDCERWNTTHQWETDYIPDTCHCWNAIENPSQYLENHYHILDEQWTHNKTKPMNHYKNFMQDYSYRISSFPIQCSAAACERLAEAGFFWSGDSVQCAFCPIVLDHPWKKRDDFFKSHFQLNPKCPYLIKPFDLPFHMKYKSTFPDAKDILWKMYDYSQRLSSFQDKWPKSDIVDPKKLAQAGFFYLTQQDDTVQCPFCQIVLSGWKDGDDPFKDHFKFKPNCPYLMNFKPPTTTEKTISKDDQQTKIHPKLVCKICLDREISITFQPCGHCVTCPSCSESILDCPICRKPIVHKIFSYIG